MLIIFFINSFPLACPTIIIVFLSTTCHLPGAKLNKMCLRVYPWSSFIYFLYLAHFRLNLFLWPLSSYICWRYLYIFLIRPFFIRLSSQSHSRLYVSSFRLVKSQPPEAEPRQIPSFVLPVTSLSCPELCFYWWLSCFSIYLRALSECFTWSFTFFWRSCKTSVPLLVCFCERHLESPVVFERRHSVSSDPCIYFF